MVALEPGPGMGHSPIKFSSSTLPPVLIRHFTIARQDDTMDKVGAGSTRPYYETGNNNVQAVFQHCCEMI